MSDAECGGVPQRGDERARIGEPSDLLLEFRVGVAHDLRVEPRAGHDEEGVLVLRTAGPADVDAGHVHLADGSGERGMDRVGHVIEREVEVAGQQVAGATGQEGEGGILRCSQYLRDRSHRAVPADRDHDRRALREGLGGLAGSRILLGGLEPEHRPALGTGLCGDRRAQVVDLHIDRVVDHGCCEGVGHELSLGMLAGKVAGLTPEVTRRDSAQHPLETAAFHTDWMDRGVPERPGSSLQSCLRGFDSRRRV